MQPIETDKEERYISIPFSEIAMHFPINSHDKEIIDKILDMFQEMTK